MTHMRVLVTGAAGFVGSAVKKAFEATGADVDGVDARSASGVLDVDLADKRQVEQLFTREPYDVVAHLAASAVGSTGLLASARTDPGKAVDVNIGGTVRLVEAASQAGVRRFLYASSTTVYGPARLYGPDRITEDADLRPTSVYGATKTSAEHLGRCLAEDAGLDFVALRLPLVYGAHRWYGGALAPLHGLLAAIGTGDRDSVSLDTSAADWLHVDDAGHAFVLLAEMASPGEAYHLVGHTGSMLELGQEIVKLSGANDIALEPRRSKQGPQLPLLSDARARRDFGFRPLYCDVHSAAQSLVGKSESAVANDARR